MVFISVFQPSKVQGAVWYTHSIQPVLMPFPYSWKHYTEFSLPFPLSLITPSCTWFHFIINRQQLYYFKEPQFPGIQTVLKAGLKTQLDISLNTNMQRLMEGSFLGTTEYLYSIGRTGSILTAFMLLLKW